jgi:hypothetical protein
MIALERRQAANAALRQKIDQIQAGNQTIKSAMDELEVRLIASARQPGSWPMSDAQSALNQLQALFKSQRGSLLEAQADISGDDDFAHRRPGNAPLISADEMAALMKIQN